MRRLWPSAAKALQKLHLGFFHKSVQLAKSSATIFPNSGTVQQQFSSCLWTMREF
jgi:hypothetical protein